MEEIEKARKDAIATLNAADIKIETKITIQGSASKSKKVSVSKSKKDEVVCIQDSELNAIGVSITNDDDLIDHEEDDFEDKYDEIQDDDIEFVKDLLKDGNTISSLTGELMLKDYGDDVTDSLLLSKKIMLTMVDDSTGKNKTVRKSTLLWFLVSNPEKQSSDRLQRVKVSEISSHIARLKTPPIASPTDFQFFRRQEEITIGEWCLFHVEEQLLIGLILGFKYLSGNSVRDTKYSKHSVPVRSPDNALPRGIGVLATWHKLERQSKNPCTFLEMEKKVTDKSSGTTTFNDFFDIRNYIGTVEKPFFLNEALKLKNFQLAAVLEILPYLKKGNYIRCFKPKL